MLNECWCVSTPDKDLYWDNVNGSGECWFGCSPTDVSHCVPHRHDCQQAVARGLNRDDEVM